MQQRRAMNLSVILLPSIILLRSIWASLCAILFGKWYAKRYSLRQLSEWMHLLLGAINSCRIRFVFGTHCASSYSVLFRYLASVIWLHLTKLVISSTCRCTDKKKLIAFHNLRHIPIHNCTSMRMSAILYWQQSEYFEQSRTDARPTLCPINLHCTVFESWT